MPDGVAMFHLVPTSTCSALLEVEFAVLATRGHTPHPGLPLLFSFSSSHRVCAAEVQEFVKHRLTPYLAAQILDALSPSYLHHRFPREPMNATEPCVIALKRFFASA